jgi:hypothetical protein
MTLIQITWASHPQAPNQIQTRPPNQGLQPSLPAQDSIDRELDANGTITTKGFYTSRGCCTSSSAPK